MDTTAPLSPPPDAPEDAWTLHSADRRPWLRGYLGNGHLAVQLVAEGGLASRHGVPLHLMAGLYDRAPDREVEHPAALPDWSSLHLSLDGRPLDPDEATGYEQRLELRAGLAETRHAWSTGGVRLEAVTTLAVLRHEPHLALATCALRADRACTVAVRKDLDPAGLPGMRDGTVAAAADRITAVVPTRERSIAVALAGTLLPPSGAAGWALSAATEPSAGVSPAQVARWFTDRSPEITAPSDSGPARAHRRAVIAGSLDLAPGRTETITWLVAVTTAPDAAQARQVADAALTRSIALGPETLLARHRADWEALWRADVQIEGDIEVRRFTRAGLFALLCSVRPRASISIAPMGLSGMGYNGHIFWDADTWMFPPLLLLHPAMARSMLAYRQDRLPAARERARTEGFDGAMFPWESGSDGAEVTPGSIARTGLKEHHITACVALAHWQYYLASGDRDWLATHGWPVLEAAARFWASRAVPGDGGYEIRDVIAADEYAEDVDNDAFTNGAARAALLAAVDAAALLGHPVPPDWRAVAEGLVLRRDGDLVLEFDGYDGRTIKQGDVELLTFPLEYPLSGASIARNLETYRRVTDPDGPAMGKSISAVVAAQLGRRQEALDLFLGSYRPHLWGPFYALAETPSNGVVHFLTGVGGALQSLLFGFAGIRLHREALAVDPLLPPGWGALRFPAIQWRGQSLALAVLPGDRCAIGFEAAGVGCTLTLQRWRPGLDPLLVSLEAAAPCTATLLAEGWRTEAAQSDHAWRLHPPPGGPAATFVLLRLTIQAEGSTAVFAIEQRVRDGDA